MLVKEIRERAQAMGIPKIAKMKKAELIQAIQRSEGNRECFGQGPAMNCGELGCLWRDDCFNGAKS